MEPEVLEVPDAGPYAEPDESHPHLSSIRFEPNKI
jgi:hypothetical protein